MEIWEDIVGYEGIYQISSLGRVKSVPRVVNHNYSGILTIKEKIRKPYINKGNGYKYITLSKNGKVSVITIHCLVALAFLDYKLGNRKIVVDHINNIKTDNRLENLQIITNRENSSKDSKNKTGYTCVYESLNKFRVRMIIDKQIVNLGSFNTKEEAYQVYLNKKASI